jgi:long-chain acyl-CoA synthetase
VPDVKWGETVKAVVVRRQGASVTDTALIEWSRDKLAGFKRPTSVDFVDALPRNASGKAVKRALREPYWVGHRRRIS